MAARVGVEGSEKLLKECWRQRTGSGAHGTEVKRVNVDTTVQRRRSRFRRMRGCITGPAALVRVAQSCNFQLRQSYEAGEAGVGDSRSVWGGAATEAGAARNPQLRTYLGRGAECGAREIEAGDKAAQVVSVARRILTQQRRDHGRSIVLMPRKWNALPKAKCPSPTSLGAKCRS